MNWEVISDPNWWGADFERMQRRSIVAQEVFTRKSGKPLYNRESLDLTYERLMGSLRLVVFPVSACQECRAAEIIEPGNPVIRIWPMTPGEICSRLGSK